MSELLATIREAVAMLGQQDRALRRFGAAAHRYDLAPPVSSLAAVEAALGTTLPDDLAMFATQIAAGGAGPYYGLLPIERAAQHVVATTGGRALPLSHLGCGYAALAILEGEHRGEVWLDARAVGMVRPIYPSFTAFYLAWVDCLARGRALEGYVPAGVCPLPAALGGYLAFAEERLGLPSGTIAGDDLREVLALVPEHAIEIGAQGSPLFADQDPVDPCVVCARMLENLAADGLAENVLTVGLRPLPQR